MNNQSPFNTVKISGYKVYQPNSDKLIIEKTFKESLFPFILIAAFFILWYYGLLSATGHNDPNIFTRVVKIISDEPPMIIFFLVPLFIILPLLYKLSKNIFSKDSFFIDGKRGTIMKNNRLFTSFADIKKIIHNPQKPALIIELDDNSKIEIIKSRNQLGLQKVGAILSEFTKIKISRK